MAPEVQQYTGITTCPFFGAAQACFYLRPQSKTYRYGHTPVEGRSDGTRGEPQNSPCAAPEVQQNQRNPHSIKGRADIPQKGGTHVSNPVPRALLSMPWPEDIAGWLDWLHVAAVPNWMCHVTNWPQANLSHLTRSSLASYPGLLTPCCVCCLQQ